MAAFCTTKKAEAELKLYRKFSYKSFCFFLGSYKADLGFRIESQTTLQVQKEFIRRFALESYVYYI